MCAVRDHNRDRPRLSVAPHTDAIDGTLTGANKVQHETGRLRQPPDLLASTSGRDGGHGYDARRRQGKLHVLRTLGKPYGLAVLVTLTSVAVTRATWPFFSIAPFAPVFAAVAVATHWGSGRAGLLAILLAAGGMATTLPSSGFHLQPLSVAVFAAIALVGSRLIDGRNRATAALRAREAELRATLEDVRASEEKVRRAQKMEAVGQLAAGVAHNFNNLLQVTMGYTDILLDDCEDALVRSAATEIRRSTERGAALTRHLLAFGRKHDPRDARIEPAATVAALSDMLTRVIREDIQLTMDLAGARAVLIDPNDLEQVIFNLVINARDALPRGGTIHVSLDAATVDAATGPGEHSVTAGEYVRLRVRDNGVGMTPDVQAHLFEPFFTTKEVGEGTGLGLAFVQGVARHAGGFVTIDTAPHQGTTVSLYLPPDDGPAAAPDIAPPPEPKPSAAPATILLVEDETAVRTMAAKMLERAGYTVLAASTPSEACAIFEAEPARISLLLTDIVMPEMHGPVLAERLVAQRPDLPVVFVSGYSDSMPGAGSGGGRMAFLPKPFTASALIAAVQGSLLPAVGLQ
jgi:signal transduction histidine kinase